MKRALYFVYVETHFLELARLAELLRARAGYEAVFFFAYRYPAWMRDVETSLATGYRCLDADGNTLAVAPTTTVAAAGGSAPRPGLLHRFWSRLPERLRRHLASLPGWLRRLTLRQALLALVFPRLPMHVESLRQQRALAEGIVSDVSPRILLMPEDNVGFMTGELIRAAHARGVPSLIVPFTIANAEEFAENYWHKPDYSAERWRGRLAGALYPKWVYEHRGRRLLALPADRLVAIELLGMSPPRPWIINSGAADAIAVEGQFMRDYYLAAGLPERQLVVTGALYDDVLHAQMAAARGGSMHLRTELGLDPARPLLLCALPPDQFSTGRPGVEFADYEELIRAWGRALKSAHAYAVLIRPHPRTRPEEVAVLRDEFGLTLTDKDTASLIPHCDVYVACVSATIRMAIAAGKPVVNYDCYRYRWQDFAKVPGVVTIEDETGFRQELARLSDPSARDALAARQREFAARANLLDGRAHERMLALVERLVAEARRKREGIPLSSAA